ncbi:MAG: hypothetical protein ABSF32_07000 [Ignavibacteria bacterium]|jgi:hypothetical protein
MRTKKVKPPHKKYEYTLGLSLEHDRIFKKNYILFRFNTTKVFLTFRYILNIETQVNGNTIFFNIAGFRAPTGDLSNPGLAEYEYKFYDFKFTDYLIIIGRKDVGSIKFKMKMHKAKKAAISISSIPKHSFIEISV